MRIAFVQQPIGHLLLPRGDRPLRSNSTGIWTYEIAVRCVDQHDVTVFGPSPEAGDMLENHRGVRFHYIATGFDLWRLNQAAKVRKLAERFGRRPDPTRPYYLSYLYFLQYAWCAALVARRSRCDLIHLANFPQFIPIFRRLNPRARIVLHMHCDWLRQLDAGRLQRFLDDADFVFGCSRYIAQGVRERFASHADSCSHLHNGVDTSFFQPAEAPPAEPPELVFVGRISPEKGVHVLLQAFERIAEAVPGVRLTLVGPQKSAPAAYIADLDPDPLVQKLARFYSADPAEYFKTLQARIPPGLRDQVTFLPSCPQAELLPVYQRAALLIVPSVWSEPFGMPAAEAMACGVPVVATRRGGLGEIVENDRTGLLVEPEDVSGLAEAVLTLLRDPGRRRAMGVASYRRVLEFFTWDRIAQELLDSFMVNRGDIPDVDFHLFSSGRPVSRGRN